MIAWVVSGVFLLIWFVLLRPRKGGSKAPPTVTSSTVIPVPIFGVLAGKMRQLIN